MSSEEFWRGFRESFLIALASVVLTWAVFSLLALFAAHEGLK